MESEVERERHRLCGSFSGCIVQLKLLGTAAALAVFGLICPAFGQLGGYVYTNGTFTTLADPSSNSTSPSGINNSGEIVGSAGKVGFLYSNGGFTTLDDPLGTFGTQPFGINNSGQIVGTYTDAPLTLTSPTNGQHGLLYSNGVFSTLNDPLGTFGSQAHGINDLGQIVGTYSTGPCVTCNHGFLYTNGVYTTIDAPSAVGQTFLLGINNAGQIIGLTSDPSGGAFLYSDGVFTALNVSIPSAFATEPLGINNLGQIVGTRMEPTPQLIFRRQRSTKPQASTTWDRLSGITSRSAARPEFPAPSPVRVCPALSWRALAFSAGGDGDGNPA